MKFLIRLFVSILKLFSLPYRITKMMARKQQEKDAETILDVLRDYKNED